MTEPSSPARPVPVPDALSVPFWEAAARGVLVLARCRRCERLSLPPEVVCPRCFTPEPGWEWEEVSGRGSIRSWTVARKGFLGGVETPFVLVDVEVVEQADLRLIGRLLDGPNVRLRLGDEVVTEFEELGPGLGLPVFRLRTA